MIIRFEELRADQRLGGIETATVGLATALTRVNAYVERSSQTFAPEKKPNLVHLHGLWSPSLLCRSLGWLFREVPLVASTHGMLEPWAFAHKRWKKRVGWMLYQRALLERVDCLHATSEPEVENLRKLGVRKPIAVIPIGVEIPKKRTLDEARAGNRPYTALFLSRIHPKKGLPLLIEAWAEIQPEGWQMRVVGPDDGDHRSELQRRVADVGLDHQWTFESSLEGDDKWQAYREANLFILPTHSENFGIVVPEALASGLPVITTQGTPWQSLERERCGWWVPVSSESIGEALRDATSRSFEELAAMGERGRLLVECDYGWEHVAKQMIDCYRWILGDGSKPACVR